MKTEVIFDKRKLVLVFLNIIKNACQAIQKDGGIDHGAILKMRLLNDEKSAIVSIEDNGSGYG
jgi:nitrogen fixation/metabolism regulation signal transduction histidine kinase